MDGGSKSGNGNNTRYTPSSSNRRNPYAVLNLSQSSLNKISDESIRDSYKRLSRLLHPDKRPPGKERDDAQELFIELQHACKFMYLMYMIYAKLMHIYTNLIIFQPYPVYAYDMNNSNPHVFSYPIYMIPIR